MADPARYEITPMAVVNQVDGSFVQASLHIERTVGYGDWIKWHDFEDYKAAQRRNASAEMNAKLGFEIAELRSRIKELENK